MILRKSTSPVESGTVGSGTVAAWKAFADVQQSSSPAVGFITQPAHAALAGQVAAAAARDLFGDLPDDALEAIARHDEGWAGPDLAALECSGRVEPAGFLAYPPEKAVQAWQRSIEAAERRSVLQGVLTSRHFCTLAPRDEHPAHERFLRAENERRAPLESDFRPEDLQRWTAALGFCDLVSLCLCSGVEGALQIPVAHPAAPEARDARQLTLEIATGRVRLEGVDRFDEREISVAGWDRTTSGTVASCSWAWRFPHGASDVRI